MPIFRLIMAPLFLGALLATVACHQDTRQQAAVPPVIITEPRLRECFHIIKDAAQCGVELDRLERDLEFLYSLEETSIHPRMVHLGYDQIAIDLATRRFHESNASWRLWRDQQCEFDFLTNQHVQSVGREQMLLCMLARTRLRIDPLDGRHRSKAVKLR